MSVRKRKIPVRDAVIEAIRLLRDKSPQCDAFHPGVIESAIPHSLRGDISETFVAVIKKPTVVNEYRDGNVLVREERTEQDIVETEVPPDISTACASAARDGFLRKVRVLLPAMGSYPQTTVALYDLAEPRTRLQEALAAAWRPSINSVNAGCYGGLPKHIREKVAADVLAEEEAERRRAEDEDPVTGQAEY